MKKPVDQIPIADMRRGDSIHVLICYVLKRFRTALVHNNPAHDHQRSRAGLIVLWGFMIMVVFTRVTVKITEI